MIDPITNIVSRLRDVPMAISQLPLHEPIVPSLYGLDDPVAQIQGLPIYPDYFSIGDAEAIQDLLDTVADLLPLRARPPLGLLLLAASLSRTLAPGLRVVLVGSGADYPLATLLERLNRDRALT
jgi:hypothetical protein